MNTTIRTAIQASCITALLLHGASAFAADACSEYKWDVASEVRLYASKPTELGVAATLDKAPSINIGTLYALALQPQDTVQYPVAPSKKMLPDGSHGGLMKFKVARTGAYRIALDAGYWIDVVHAGKSLPALDFNGQRQCNGPRKIVVYELPAGAELTLQIAQSSDKTARLTVTPVAAPTP
jgi:hypothetical protein